MVIREILGPVTKGLFVVVALVTSTPVESAELPEAELDALVAQGDEVVFHKGYGMAHRKRRLPNFVDTAFDVGSIAKTFTAAAIYKLAEDGRLNLDDPLGEYFDAVPENKRSITIDQLLNHRAGLPQYHDRGDFEVLSRDRALERIFRAELQASPGESYAYSNSGYTLLAILVEEVTGQPFRDYCREHVFEPLGMQQTGFYGDRERWQEDRVATGYGDGRQGKNSPWHWRTENLWALEGNGGVVSTAGDLLRWAAARERFFPPPQPPQDLGTKRRFADGWYLAFRENTGLQVFHGGASDKGFLAMVRSYPERDATLILLSNTFKAKKPHIRSHMDEIEDLLFAP
jgi:CubicO group peptidase (beta-lactamase class C family)